MRQPNIIQLIARPLVWMALALLLGPMGVCAQDEATPASEQKGLQQRIDFGNAHILGQNIKSGAVYLMHRKKSDIKSMLEVRENYRQEIIEDYSLERTAITGNVVQGAGDPPK